MSLRWGNDGANTVFNSYPALLACTPARGLIRVVDSSSLVKYCLGITYQTFNNRPYISGTVTRIISVVN